MIGVNGSVYRRKNRRTESGIGCFSWSTHWHLARTKSSAFDRIVDSTSPFVGSFLFDRKGVLSDLVLFNSPSVVISIVCSRQDLTLVMGVQEMMVILMVRQHETKS